LTRAELQRCLGVEVRWHVENGEKFGGVERSRDWYSADLLQPVVGPGSPEFQNSNLDPPHGVWQYAARTVCGGGAQRILLIPLSSILCLIPD
jgi:hypothetical protein